MIVLGIETSCDETSVAVLEFSKNKTAPTARILSNLIASQHEIHLPYGGIFPELASRRHIEVIRPLVEQALQKAGISQDKIDGIAVTHAPGLVGALLVGLSFAKAYAYALKKPFIGVSHLEGHLNAPFLEHPKIPYPHIGLVVSGGHTALYHVKKFGEYNFIGGTRDDAAGEAFDKIAKILGLGYPGGPVVDKLAKSGNAKAIRFPKPKIAGLDFSFSGLKTAVKNLPLLCKEGPGEVDPGNIPDVCASIQETIVDVLIEKTLEAARAKKCKAVLVTGGVACNSRLRVKLTEEAAKKKIKAYFASPVLSTDNAAMITYVGGRYLMMGKQSPLSLNAIASLNLKQPYPKRDAHSG